MSDSLWIERLEAVEAEIKALKASWAPAEFVSLRDRVKELEGAKTDERVIVASAAEFARLRRIEAAARELCFGPVWPEKRADDMAKLREALK